MKVALVFVSILLLSCENPNFEEFKSTTTCTVKAVTGGSQITCPDGTTQFVPDGQTGSTGAKGDTGSKGDPGDPGSSGSKGDPGTPGSNGHNSLISVATADSSLCTNGGSVFSMGTDLNDDATLELTETTSTAVVCNGNNGSNGHDGNNAPPTPFTPVALVEPCATNPNNPSATDLANPNLEIFLKMSSGLLLATVSANQAGLNTHIGVVAPGMNWVSTGIGSNCVFSVDSTGTITRH